MQDSKKYDLKIEEISIKLKETQKRNRSLRQRNKELGASRLLWKAKSQKFLKELRLVKKSLWLEEKKKKGKIDERPKGYQYSTLVICLAIWFRTYCNCSLRGCTKILEVISKMLDLGIKVPNYTTIHHWECKLGLYRLEKKPVEKGRWTLIIDESISIARQRILLILGCKLDNYNFDRPLSLKDVRVLSMGVDKSWTELCIGQRIEQLKSKGYEFVNGVSDGGKAIVKALKVSKLNRTADCTHALGNLLKRQYKKQEGFMSFSKLCGQLKQRLMNGTYAYLIPPSQRVKGRFLNLFELSDWGHNMIRTLESRLGESINPAVVEKLSPLQNSKQLINQIYTQCQSLKLLFKILKAKGLSKKSKEKCEQILLKSKANDFFKRGVRDYLKDNLKEDQQLLCSSDIIESIFGKFKNRMSKNKLSGFGLSCLTLANMTEEFTLEETKTAMQVIRMADLEKWKKENLYPNMINKRKDWIKSTRRNFVKNPEYETP